MGVDYPGAIDMVITDPAWVFTDALLNVANSDITIIDHKTACGGNCTATQIAQNFANDTVNHKSVHFVVGRDGSVIQVVRLKDGAGGNCCTSNGYNAAYYDPLFAKYGRNANLFTVSIEHEDWTTDNSQPMTAAQIDASNKLNLWLCQRYGIGPANIHSHASLDPVNRARCPGPTFDFNQLFTYVNNGGTSPVPAPPPNYQRKAFETEWRSILPTVSLTSGIANAAWQDYQAGNFRGPALTQELDAVNWGGQPIKVQITVGGRYEWDGSPHFYPYL